jgi:hypothetical protein
VSRLARMPMLRRLLVHQSSAVQELVVRELVKLELDARAEAFEDALRIVNSWERVDDVRWELDVQARAHRKALAK